MGVNLCLFRYQRLAIRTKGLQALSRRMLVCASLLFRTHSTSSKNVDSVSNALIRIKGLVEGLVPLLSRREALHCSLLSRTRLLVDNLVSIGMILLPAWLSDDPVLSICLRQVLADDIVR